MSGWKPIASGPKDGTLVLLCERPFNWIGIGRYDRREAGLPWTLDGGFQVTPSHWMALPKVPGKSRTRIRSAKHGQFASKDDADASPDTHIRETVR